MPKVSICVPAYQNPEEVQRLVESAAAQTFQDYELILTDDSKDSRIEDYIGQLRDSKACVAEKIRYFHNEKPLGHIFNWNEAISHGKGEYIKIMFSDDWFTYPDSLEKLVKLLEEDPQADLAFSGSMQVSEKTAYARKPGSGYCERLAEDHRRLFMGNEIGAPSDTLYRNRPGIAFDEKSNWASDVFLYFEILQRNPRFVCTEDPLISIGIHENQYTNSFSDNDERIFKDYEYMFQKYNLRESEECRAYFLEKYLIRQKKGMSKAVRNGYTRAEFAAAWTARQVKVILPSYWNALLKKLKRK